MFENKFQKGWRCYTETINNIWTTNKISLAFFLWIHFLFPVHLRWSTIFAINPRITFRSTRKQCSFRTKHPRPHMALLCDIEREMINILTSILGPLKHRYIDNMNKASNHQYSTFICSKYQIIGYFRTAFEMSTYQCTFRILRNYSYFFLLNDNINIVNLIIVNENTLLCFDL